MVRQVGFLVWSVGFLVGWTNSARADKLDERLNQEMPKVVRQLQKEGVRNVAVLRFQAAKAGGKLGFQVGPINSSMVERLENLLVIHAGSDTGPLLGVARNAGQVAQKAGVGRWSTSEVARKKLFEIDYPLAWKENKKEKKVKVDAFLTGKVVNSPDLKKTTVTLELLSRSHLRPVKVSEFTLATDHVLVRELGYRYALTKQQRTQLVRARSEGQLKQEQILDDLVLAQAMQGQRPVQPQVPVQPQPGQKPKVQPLLPVPVQPGQAGPGSVAGIEFKVKVDNSDWAITPGTSASAAYEIKCPPRGKPIVMTLTNNSPEKKRLGVVLKVGGKNTIEEQTEDADKCRKWILEPGETFTIRGYHIGSDLTEYKPFAVLENEEARRAIEELGDKAQFIQVDVFTDEVPITPLRVTTRGASPAVLAAARRSYTTLREQLMKSGKLVKVRSRDGEMVIGAASEPAKTTSKPEVVEFNANPAPLGSLTIKVTPNPTQPQPQPLPVPQPQPLP